MKTIITLLFLLVVVPLVGQDPHNEFTDKLDEYFTALANQQNFNGNVIVARNREVLLNNTYNMKSENDSLFVTKDSRFLIASLSKNFLNISFDLLWTSFGFCNFLKFSKSIKKSRSSN